MEILQPSWRGTKIQSRKDASGKYMSLIGCKALLFVPVNVLPNFKYRVSLELKSISGNGILYCNIFGNRSFDFPHCRIECKNGTWSTYDIDLQTKEFPKTLPLYFRIWRSNDGTGELCIRRITVSILEGECNSSPQLVYTSDEGSVVSSNIEKRLSPREIRMKRREEERLKKRKTVQKEENIINSPITKKQNIATISHNIKPKILPIINEGIKISVVISSFNRIEFFDRSLKTYSKQTIPKEDFELVVVDDNSSDDILKLCKRYNSDYGLQFQFISLDKTKGAIEARTFTPALSNNVGFKKSRGSVIVITGPETLQKETNLEKSWECANNGYCVYGSVYRSDINFVNSLVNNPNLINSSFDDIIKLKGAKADSSVFNGWWWYYVAVRKEFIMDINGVDERFMLGISGEDDDFSKRMIASGVPLIRSTDIIGIHQDHSKEDLKESTHSWRFDKRKWKSLRKNNEKLLDDWIKHKNPVTNKNIDWGSEKAIIRVEILE